MTEAKTMINLRARPTDVARIDQLATEAGMSRTKYMIRSALGELDAGRTITQRLDNLEAQLQEMKR